MTRRLLLLTVVLLAGTTVTGAAQRGRKPSTHTVTIEGMQFTPSTVTARPGDTISWVNKDIVAHTATAAGAAFDSKVIPPGKSWKVTLKARGSVSYVCSYHPTMKGVVRVE
jgi:plastocyanin